MFPLKGLFDKNFKTLLMHCLILLDWRRTAAYLNNFHRLLLFHFEFEMLYTVKTERTPMVIIYRKFPANQYEHTLQTVCTLIKSPRSAPFFFFFKVVLVIFKVCRNDFYKFSIVFPAALQYRMLPSGNKYTKLQLIYTVYYSL